MYMKDQYDCIVSFIEYRQQYMFFFFFFFNYTATTEIYPLPLHDALPIWASVRPYRTLLTGTSPAKRAALTAATSVATTTRPSATGSRPVASTIATPRRGERASVTSRVKDRKSTRLNSSHLVISYAVFCLK